MSKSEIKFAAAQAEKLNELVGQVQDCGCDVTDVVEMNYVENNVLVDHLIANGATIPVRCRECKHWNEETGFCDELSQFYNHGFDWYMFDADDFCSRGERRTDENND